MKTFNSDRLCQNATFWKDRGNEKRCKGNTPGQINPGPNRNSVRETRSYSYINPCNDNFGMTCRDNSEVVCEKTSIACTSNLTKFCDSKETCVHHTLECDGYIQCPDGSDEEETKCKVCPRDFGYPANKLKVYKYVIHMLFKKVNLFDMVLYLSPTDFSNLELMEYKIGH